MRENPFRYMGGWYWWDDKDQRHGPYASQGKALYDLLAFCAPLPWWERFARKITEFVRA